MAIHREHLIIYQAGTYAWWGKSLWFLLELVLVLASPAHTAATVAAPLTVAMALVSGPSVMATATAATVHSSLLHLFY